MLYNKSLFITFEIIYGHFLHVFLVRVTIKECSDVGQLKVLIYKNEASCYKQICQQWRHSIENLF